MVSERYIRERCEREYGELRNFGGITDEAKFRWRDKGEPKPFLFPNLWGWPTGDYAIWFVTSGSDETDIQYFLDNRDAILDRYLELMEFPQEERVFIKTRLFRWHRHLPTGEEYGVRRLPPDACLTTRSLPQSPSLEHDQLESD
ncbi:hypothetical protein CC1G_07243 [Coprinopsis cinerea okayama7|uniref:Uncharacterized protein n=1 Tax=Coprinopsis cinerea (strain Okayama-7 / 130 / ATCC MYA-4618 / FGSC 9003) TaxID=240176 RepID=A8PD25_COPC7|nr:hypothetical protein CC1G_07243 [Coprinopsis cinerea okayama7\|eukprot:XP_001840513.1 hypothetical protein CC1G_07243 [Coprinopsis cinerea okayama7\